MDHRTKTFAALTGMLFCQLAVAMLLWISTQAMERHWNETLQGAVLPWGTMAALRYGLGIPITAGVFTVAIGRMSLKSQEKMIGWLLLLALVEIVALGLFSIGISEPSMFITYGLSK